MFAGEGDLEERIFNENQPEEALAARGAGADTETSHKSSASNVCFISVKTKR